MLIEECFCKKFINKTILEFGCGNGDFHLARKSQRELQVLIMFDYREYIQSKKIECFRNFEELEKFDVILSFHVIEHLPDPINEIKN